MLELGYIAVLEAAAERIKGSTPFAWTNLARWRAPYRASGWQLHSQTKLHNGSVAQLAVHYLGKIEVMGPNPVGASTIITMRHGWFYSVVE